ncbi:MAG TPA: transglycosylase SLT domain-containing protein [Candidatus Limnocylindria bacterium]|jgi:membrane-bound lytic murein transglycosylase B|nr:transglycosylase SLT domain-containing protein [Candidatus Limnocylindria bacterium]
MKHHLFRGVLPGLLFTACAVSSGAPSPLTPAPDASATIAAVTTPSASPQPTPSPREDPPVVASEPSALARQIDTAERAVRDRGVSGAELAWMGHLQQRAYRRIAAQPELREPVFAALPVDIRPIATANLDATADLRATVVPGPNLPTTWRIVEPAPLDDLARYYREAETEFGVPWSYLAAIHLVETRMGRIRGTSVAGAQGPMQFMPATWAAYGEGDVNSDRDAIRAAARYLRANGAPGRMSNALFRYNQSERYVRAVTAYAEVMRAEPDAYRGYYQWQVYYLTTRGDIFLPVGYGS